VRGPCWPLSLRLSERSATVSQRNRGVGGGVAGEVVLSDRWVGGAVRSVSAASERSPEYAWCLLVRCCSDVAERVRGSSLDRITYGPVKYPPQMDGFKSFFEGSMPFSPRPLLRPRAAAARKPTPNRTGDPWMIALRGPGGDDVRVDRLEWPLDNLVMPMVSFLLLS